MPDQSPMLKDALSQSEEITISVTGRKSGRTISIPVWFVLEGDELFLLPVKGSDTEWYKNALKDSNVGVKSGNAKGEFKATLVRDSDQVASVVEKFRKKYGANNVKKYYSKFDVAVRLPVV